MGEGPRRGIGPLSLSFSTCNREVTSVPGSQSPQPFRVPSLAFRVQWLDHSASTESPTRADGLALTQSASAHRKCSPWNESFRTTSQQSPHIPEGNRGGTTCLCNTDTKLCLLGAPPIVGTQQELVVWLRSRSRTLPALPGPRNPRLTFMLPWHQPRPRLSHWLGVSWQRGI